MTTSASLNGVNKRCITLLVLLVTVCLISSCISLITPSVNRDITKLEPGEYKIDPSHTALIFKIEHLGLSTYVGRFNKVRASLNFDPNKLADTQLSAAVDTASIDLNDDDLEEQLRGSSWFNTHSYPEATFKTLSVKALPNDQFSFTGELTLLNVTKPIVLIGKFNGGANNFLTGKYTLGFSATGSFKRSNFGMDKYIPLVGDDVLIEVFAEFQKQ